MSSEARQVAVLCAARNSVYHALPGVEVYDAARDARTFAGGMPIIAHPPCRAWSKYTRHQAKPEPGEAELGLWCCEKLRECGGVLEQPTHSLLWDAAGLPVPGRFHGADLWSMEVWQAWWGYPTKKTTWLAFCGVEPSDVHPQYRLHPRGGDQRRFELMSKNQRSATNQVFARWLVDLARKSRVAVESDK